MVEGSKTTEVTESIKDFGWRSFRRGCCFVLTLEVTLGAIALFVWFFFGGGK